MENLIACSLVENGLKCGEALFIPSLQYQIGIMMMLGLGALVGVVFMFFAWAYEEKEFKQKMRDLGYGHILGELSGASEKWIPKHEYKPCLPEEKQKQYEDKRPERRDRPPFRVGKEVP
jgi:hypothetical protein